MPSTAVEPGQQRARFKLFMAPTTSSFASPWDRALRHVQLRRQTAAYEALLAVKKHYPWRLQKE